MWCIYLGNFTNGNPDGIGFYFKIIDREFYIKNSFNILILKILEDTFPFLNVDKEDFIQNIKYTTKFLDYPDLEILEDFQFSDIIKKYNIYPIYYGAFYNGDFDDEYI